MSLLQHTARPVDQVWEYDIPRPPFKTPLYLELDSICSDFVAFNKSFTYALAASSHLGGWCSDQVWTYALSEKQSNKVLGNFELTEMYRQFQTIGEKQAARDLIKKAAATAQSYRMMAAKPTEEDLSPKELLLYKKLSQLYTEQDTTRCIVFVEQRLTARILADLFLAFGVPNLRPAVLIGVGGNQIGDDKESWKEHEETMDNFRAGVVNC
jgi:endoribonuclease Dicer